MKKSLAVFMLVAYMGTLLLSFVNAHQSLHSYVCSDAGKNLQPGHPFEPEENCCDYRIIHQKLQHHHSQTSFSLYKVKLPVAYCTASKVLALLQPQIQHKFHIITPVTTLAHPDIYLKNGILLI